MPRTTTGDRRRRGRGRAHISHSSRDASPQKKKIQRGSEGGREGGRDEHVSVGCRVGVGVPSVTDVGQVSRRYRSCRKRWRMLVASGAARGVGEGEGGG